MKQTATSTRRPTAPSLQPSTNPTIPFPAPPSATNGRTAAADSAAEPDHGADAGPAGGAPRGRPSGCSDRVVAMMKGLIRKHGFSDTAAAEGVGVSSTTISRWKKQDPELAAELLQARYECRIHHLEIIEKTAEAENGGGWRASAWILERLFPGDYSPRMRERFAYRNLEDQRRDNEERALVYDDIRLRLEREEARREEARRAQAEQGSRPGPAFEHEDEQEHEYEHAGALRCN